ncbi:MAG TPA: hypothetical protein VK704_00240 [Acidimicrobiales bacterium]|nr:hypothetical protein [Acidimicrobiales bacterium]
MTSIPGAVFGSAAVVFFAIALLLFVSTAGSLMTYVIIVIANRADPDPSGKRPMAAYLFGGAFFSLWLSYLGSIIIVEALVSLMDTVTPSTNTIARIVVAGFLMVLVGGAVHMIHRQRGLALADSETDPSSPTKRVMRSYVAAVSFITVLIAVISAIVLGYLIFQLVAPGVFGASGTRVDVLSSIIDWLYIVGATAFIFLTHQALAPTALRLIPRGRSMGGATSSVVE